MIRSMTGYGSSSQVLNGREISVEIRSVNNRYLDCNVKLPRAYSFAEDAVKQEVKRHASRGKVDVYITVVVRDDKEVSVRLNRGVLEGYLTALRTVASDYGVRDDMSVMSLSRLPDVFTVEKPEEDEQVVQTDILTVAKQALDKYDAMRTVEGQALADDVRSKAATIADYVSRVEERSPETVSAYRQRLRAKLEEVLQNTEIDENRILTEAALYADKVAVDEETVRLRSHLAQLDEMLRTGGAVGRKLDFLLQEMNRETNTIGSKCNDLTLTGIVVDMKSELEKIREQIQNME